jgi:hypothetical protein
LHIPLQHSPFVEQDAVSAVHPFWQTPLTQLTEQQSVLELHVVPAAEHIVGLTVQPPCGSHVLEQQSAPVVHAWPNKPQTTLASGTTFPCLLPQATRHAIANAKTNEREVIGSPSS